MKALSVRQPWAYAIMYLGKDVENRTRLTRYRGPVAIHATRCTRAEFMQAAETIRGICGVKVPPWEAMKESFGQVIGVVDLVDSVDAWDHDGEEVSSPWAYDDCLWIVKNPRQCRLYTCKGARGYLFDIPDGAIK